jgi:hypothetical protein
MKHTLKKLLLLAAISTSVSSCVKNEIDELGSAGNTVIKILGGTDAPKIVALDLKPGTQSAAVLDVRRDANSTANLNQPVTVTLTNKQSLLDAYNDEEGTEYEVLPTSVYTVTDPSVTISGDTWTLSFAPGEFAKEIKVNVDAEAFDLSKSYALGFEIATSTLGNISVAANSSIVNVLIKNAFHGTYHASGVFTHPTAGDRAIDEDKNLVTSGARSVTAPLGDLGGSGYFMDLLVNADNTVTISPKGATPNIDQTWGDNYYDPATKSYHLHYSYNVAAPRIVKEVITLK